MEKNFQIISVQGNGRDGPAPHNFFGLKWKVLLLTSLILIAIVVSFTSITYLSLIHDFESQRSAQHQRYASEVEGLMDQISRNLHQFAELLPSLEGMEQKSRLRPASRRREHDRAAGARHRPSRRA